MKPVKIGKKHIVYGLIVLAFIVISSFIPGFLSIRNIMNIIRQSSIIAICACGMTMVIIIKGIDLSVTGVLSFCAMVNGLLLMQGWPIPLAMLAGLLAGTTLGVFNGFMVDKLGIPAFITTLVVGNVGGGLALLLNSGRSIGGFPDAYVFMGNGTILGIPVSNYIMAFFVIATTIIMAKTRLGIYIYAMGGNETVVKQQGISTTAINFFVYGFSGFCIAMAGILLSGQLDTVHPTQGEPYQLDAIAACVIGGVSMLGGEGKVYLSLVGALIIGVQRNMLNLLGIHPFYQNIFVGIIIIAIVAVNIYKKNRTIELSKVF
ncbi:ABC transporter permease [Pleomorphochaeta sp. DL1XJH-081]|jgi:ribose transport system permease protein|uniref:ABC transporter permease n=1 Tax=Pleomorphochaeta sp. DL1XJH-081 TaxID=3409690 RepID=UPI003BB730D9